MEKDVNIDLTIMYQRLESETNKLILMRMKLLEKGAFKKVTELQQIESSIIKTKEEINNYLVKYHSYRKNTFLDDNVD